ncbi:hypothetical protein AMTR_s00009p00015690 [Amborella trichopoda]|uniref:Uncharacterized protein n=1 Tax=Amborella trichopoda TaxID=13333 RepID=W1NI11_AMBTC|nr:hypothetical protein AMTR_s00009p00015690 [Amborella trichopoda]
MMLITGYCSSPPYVVWKNNGVHVVHRYHIPPIALHYFLMELKLGAVLCMLTTTGLLNLQAVVLLAMGGYGSYLGFRIKYSDDLEEKAKAKDLHPKLLGGMFFFFVVGATGGITSLLTSDKPIFER